MQSTTRAGSRGWPAPATCARSRRRPRTATPARRAPSRSTTTAWPARSRRWRPRWGGLDALVFTGGAGEGSARLRAEAARRLAFLGVAVDPARNTSAAPDAEISAAGAPVRTLVVRAREEIVIARAARAAIATRSDTRGAQ